MKRWLAASFVAAALSLGAGVGVAQEAEPQAAALPSPSPSALQELMEKELPESSLALGAQLVKLSGNSRMFDELLPNIADAAKNAFIRANPQMQLGIIGVVDRAAIDLVRRRPELDQLLSRVWANAFTEEEMQELIEFYSSDLGKKFAEQQPKLLGIEMAVADRWARSVGQELTQMVQDELRATMDAEQRALQGDVAGPAETPPAPAQ
jgi:hypothetical protein